ncbi:MAG: abortive infection system antitoxin AbiGi family protein [Bacteroidota bacterium]
MKPGTVSKILWHFTGGPERDGSHNQKTQPKDAKVSYEILKLILQSKFLKLSSKEEIIKVIIPKETNFDKIEKKRIVSYNVEKRIKSSKVFCLADIPIQHLEYHAQRYGKIAIGFYRETIIKKEFNPVLYSLQNTSLLNSFYAGFTSISNIDTENIKDEISTIDDDFKDVISEIEDNDIELDSDKDISDHISNIESECQDIDNATLRVEQSLEDFVAFIKTFDKNEFDTIYCEREWRSLKQFDFSFDDIAMILIPRENNFYNDLLKMNLVPNNIPIIPWEDIIEH